MIDDQDRCKWVNVSSGTGSPGLSRTKSCKMVEVVVVVYVLHIILLLLTVSNPEC